MKNTANISFSVNGMNRDIDCYGEVEYQIGDPTPNQHCPWGSKNVRKHLTVTTLKTNHGITIPLPITGEVIDCGSSVMTVLVIIIDENGNALLNGRCPTKEFYDRVVRAQMLRTAAERFEQALKEREMIAGYGIYTSPRARKVLGSFQ